MNIAGYKNLSRMLSEGNRTAAKGECELTFDHLSEYAGDIVAIVLPPRKADAPAFRDRLRKLARLFATAAISPPPCSFAATTTNDWPISTISRRK